MCELEPMFNLAVPSGCSNERYRSNCSGSSTAEKWQQDSILQTNLILQTGRGRPS